MPLIDKLTITKDYSIGIWHITESLETLEKEACLTSEELTIFSGSRSKKRQFEWLTTRVLLKQFFDPRPSIEYDAHGKPVLQSQKEHLSISHSHKFVAVGIHGNKPIGIDIQTPKKNIQAGKSLFLNDDDVIANSDQITEDVLHLIWGAKEAMYKFIGDSTLNIYEHFNILKISLGSMEGNCNLGGKSIQLCYRQTSDYYLVFTL